MAEPDYSLAAHPYIPPAQNPLETLKGIEQYRILQHENAKSELETQQKNIDFNKLNEYGSSGNSNDLKGASPELRTGALAGERSEEENKKDVMTRKAAEIYGEQDPKIKQYKWDRAKDDFVKRGWVDPETAKKYPTPHDGVMENIIRGGLSVPDYRKTTGQETSSEEAARAPFQGREVNPAMPYEYPAVRPGGPLGAGAPPQTALGRGAPAGAPTGTGPQPPRSANMTDTNATVLQPGQAPAGTPAAAGPPGTKNAAPVDKTNPYAAEVPEVKVGNDLPTGPGVVNQGIDPLRQAARMEGQKKFNEDVEPAATAAAKTRASLGTMKSELDKGVKTDRLGEIKTTVAAGLYALTGDTDFVKKATGMTTANQEVFNKESTRMGLTFARQTEGAREAVQAIRIALGANPSLLNTEDGNRKIIGIMDQASKYDQERAKAAQAFMQKNDGHLTGFDTWFNQSHPPASFISKAVPYATVIGGRHIAKDDLQPGVTYTYGGDKGDQFKGTWDGSHFTTVK